MKLEEVPLSAGGLVCGVAVHLGDVRHPWRPLDQVVLEWGDVQLVRRSVQENINRFLAISTDNYN